jgi:hypothetical protein
MNELEEILKLKNELANKKFEYLSKTYSTMKIKYMNLIGNCYKSEWDDEYYIINDIDFEPVNEIDIHIKLVGMRIYNYEKYPEIDIFNGSLSLIDSNMIQISFEEFEQNLNQTLEHINNFVTKLKKIN